MSKHKVAHEIFRAWLDDVNMTQSQLGEQLGVTRAAVSKWCSGDMAPSKDRARAIERITHGAIPASVWPRRELPEPPNKGTRLLRRVIEKNRLSITDAARVNGLPVRALHRWVVGDHAPRQTGIAKINAAFGLNLTLRDFGVGA